MDQLVFISTAELQDLIDSNNVDIIDTGMDHKQAYLNSHIPDSVYFNVTEIRSKTSNLSIGFPSLEEFREYMIELGLKNNKKVKVVYDRNMILSGRAWYLLKHYGVADVRILNGGLTKWVSEGRPVVSGEKKESEQPKKTEEIKEPKESEKNKEPERVKEHQEPKEHEEAKVEEAPKDSGQLKEPREHTTTDQSTDENDFNFTEDNNYLILYPEVKLISEEIQSGRTNVKIWDPRPKDVFEKGTVNSAINIPWVEFMNPDNTVKSQEEVREIFDKKLGDGPVIVTCMKGVAASFGLALLAYCGYKDRRLYAGSYEEWDKMKASA